MLRGPFPIRGTAPFGIPVVVVLPPPTMTNTNRTNQEAR